MAMFNILFGWLYVIIFGLWLYWTYIIRKYYIYLKLQRLNANNNYQRYDDNQQSNNPYITNEGV